MFTATTALKKISKLSKKIVAVQGGTSSSKTISILLLEINNAQSRKERGLTSIVSESMPHLKRGAMRDFKNIMISHGYWKDSSWNSTDSTYTFETGWQIEFFSADQPDKLRGGRRDRLFCNEINTWQNGLEAFNQLEVRTKEKVYMDWNPSSEFWFYTEVLGTRDDIDHIILTYKDNEALSPEIVHSIESRKSNKNWWQVYGLGLLGEIETRIYTGWKPIDEIPHEARLEVRGMDFGYTNDPTTIVDIYKYDGGYILDERLYRKGLHNKQIADIINNFEQNTVSVVADSAEPKSIDEIRMYNVPIFPAQKGKDSVNQGIQLVQGLKISYTKRSVNLAKEYNNYLWLEDKDGKVVNKPTPGNDHCFVGETQIETINGLVSIKDIKKGDYVLTTKGYKKVLLKHNNGVKKVNQYLLRTDTHQVIITCTPEHKIKTGKTWTPISELKKGQTVSLTKNSLEKNTGYTNQKGTLVPITKDCTESFTNIFLEKYQKVIMFIIKMVTQQITIFKTWNWLKPANIYVSMENKMLNGLEKTSNQKVLNLQNYGTRVKREENGTQITGEKLGKTENTKNTFVNNVVKPLSPVTQESLNSAIITAKLEHLECVGSWREKVYDLTIEDQHEYFANGLLVHNCLDSVRYGMQFLHPHDEDTIMSDLAIY